MFGVLIVMFVATGLRSGREEVPGLALTLFVVAAWLPLLVRRRYPGAVLTTVTVIESAHIAALPVTVSPATIVAAYQPVPLATMMAAYAFARRSPRVFGWGAGIGAATALLVASLIAQPLDLIGTDMVTFNLVVISTAAGVYAATTADKKERTARELADSRTRAVTDERLRIARELHDVLAHNLTLVNAQAGVADFLMRTDPAAASTALQGITEHTRRAIDDLRATVGLLRAPGDHNETDRSPAPRTRDIDALVSRFVDIGHDVTLTVDGSPGDLSPGTDIGVYRIVQEALTNAAKHAPNAAVTATLVWFDDRVEVDVENHAPDRSPARPPAGTNHGIIGMRERALIAGGDLTAGPTPTGGFLVHASIPR